MTGPRTTGVWISANSAMVLRWSPELTVRHRIDSTVPGRHRSTGPRIARASADRLRGAGLAADTEVRQGDPAEAIVAAAGAWPADLIVIGTRGQTGLARLLRGSVARKVLLHAGCSVLIERER